MLESTVVTSVLSPSRYFSEVRYNTCFCGNFVLTVIILKMNPTRYGSIVQYLRDKEYPAGASKAEKSVLRRFAKKFEFNEKAQALFYLDQGWDGSTFKRMVVKEDEKLRVFHECHSSTKRLNIASTGLITIRILLNGE